jgi:hypothetical protein
VNTLKSEQTLFTHTSSVNCDKNKRFTAAVVPAGKNKIKVESFSYFIDLINRRKPPLSHDLFFSKI